MIGLICAFLAYYSCTRNTSPYFCTVFFMVLDFKVNKEVRAVGR
ncbi:hypothetical protein HMPREF1554_01451 [Porphyromonas gingivalis F0569]|nr:hypothetical protein HMPREF1554_01451 [Porphyromonas gingivalis F0569]